MSTRKTLAALEKFHAGVDALSNGFVQESIVLFTDAIGYDDTNASFNVRRSQAYSMVERGVDAMADAVKAIKKDASSPEAYLRHAECLLIHHGDLVECLASIKKGLEKKPDHSALLLTKLEVLFIQKDYKAVLTEANSVIAASKEPSTVLKASKIRFHAEAALGKEEDSEFDASGFVSALVAKGQERYVAGDTQRAIDAWKNAMLLSTAIDSPSLMRMIKAKLAAAYRSIGRPDLSAEMTSGSSGGATALVDEGNTFFSSGDLDGALNSYQQAAELEEKLGNDSGFAIACNNMACVYFSMQKYELALEFFERQNTLAAKDHDVAREVASGLDIAECHMALQNYTAAHDALAKVLDHHEELFNVGAHSDSMKAANALIERSFKVASKLYLKTNHEDLALEWGERAKAHRVEADDCTIDELKAFAKTHETGLLSYQMDAKGDIQGFYLAPDGKVVHHVIASDVLRLADTSILFHEATAERQSSGDGHQTTTSGASVDDESSTRRLKGMYDALIAPFFPAANGEEGATRRGFGVDSLVLVPDGPLFEIPWPALLSPQSERLGTTVSLRLTHAAARVLKSASSLALDFSASELRSICDSSIPGEKPTSWGSTVEGASKPFSDLLPGEGNKHTHLRCRLALRRLYFEGDVEKKHIFGTVRAVPKEGRRNQDYSTTSVSAGGLGDTETVGWLYCSKAGTEPFLVNEDLSVVERNHAVGITSLAAAKQDTNVARILLLDVHGSADNLSNGGNGSLVQQLLQIYAAVVIPLTPAADENLRDQFFVDLCDKLKDLGSGSSVNDLPKIVRSALVASSENGAPILDSCVMCYT